MKQTNHKPDVMTMDGHKAGDEGRRSDVLIPDPLIDEEGWLGLIDPAFYDRPYQAQTFAQKLYDLKEGIERGGAQSTRRVIESLDEGIKLAYQYTDIHKAALRLFYLYLAGELIGDTPQELLEAAIQNAACNRKPDGPRTDERAEENGRDE